MEQENITPTDEIGRPIGMQLSRRQIVITMIGIMLAMLLSSLDQTIVTTAMPTIIADLGGFTHYTWVTTSYIIAQTITVPITGKLTDMYGRKWFYVGGISIFLIGSLLCGLSQNMTQLIISRSFQGIGSGVMMANAFVVVGDLFTPAERGKYQGFLTGVFGLSSVIGPTLGGFITDNLSWEWVFFINLPLGVLILSLFIIYFPNMKPYQAKPRIDYVGIVTLTLTVLPAMLALSWAGVDYDWVSTQIIGMFAFSAVMLVFFIWCETRIEDPLIPLHIFKNRIVAISNIIIFLTGVGMFGVIIFIPLFFQGVLGKSATTSGSFLTPMMLGMVSGSLMSGQLLSRAGGHYRRHGMVGLAIMALGMGLLSSMTPNTSNTTAILYIIITGLGTGIILPNYNIAVQNAVPHAVMGVATSSTMFFRSIGSALGLAIFGSVVNNQFSSDFTGGLSTKVKEVISPEPLDSLAHNPEALINEHSQNQLIDIFNAVPDGATLYSQLIEVMKDALNSAITEVFFLALFFVGCAWIFNLFLKEIPLRSQHD